jgi:hypothetical protein
MHSSSARHAEHYVAYRSELLFEFDQDSARWAPFLTGLVGGSPADALMRESRAAYEALISQIPYIGGESNRLTGSLLESARCLALYQAMKAQGRTVEETGKVLYDAILARMGEPQAPIPPAKLLTPEQMMEDRKKRAEQSQERRYPDDYVYRFVLGDGQEFDYGYEFIECATLKFYRAQGAAEFAPFFCFLDFPQSQVSGLGLSRTMTLAEGYDRCDHRFKAGRESESAWPPPFLRAIAP